MNIVRDILSLSDFKQNASKFVKQVQETKQPLVLTVNGKPVAVIQDAESYQQMIDSNEYRDTVSALRNALSDIENSGNWPTAEEVFANLRAKFGINKSMQ